MQVALSYLGSDGRYCGVFSLPGDTRWRNVVGPDGALLWRSTTVEAEADAGHALVAALRRLPDAGVA